VTGACGHDLVRSQRHAKLPQFIGEPRQGNRGIAEHVLAMTGELLVPQRNDRFLLDEIECAPVRRGGRPKNERVRACIVRDDLRGSRLDKIREARIGNLDRRMKCVDRIENLSHRVGGRSRRQIRMHAKGEFGLGDAHFISRHGSHPE
jgi:hypothetical protein